MRPLVCPETDVTINPVRYGGVHQGLSGARIMDVTGHRDEYELEFRFLDRDEFEWVELLHTRMVPGPHLMINPLKKNRLSLQASKLIVTPYGKAGVRAPLGARYGLPSSPPTALGYRGRSVFVGDWTDPNPRVTFDPGKYIPVLPGERLTGSVYLSSSFGNVTGSTLRFEWFDASRAPVSGTPASTSSTFNVTDGAWSRATFTNVQPPAGAVACRFSIGVGTLADPDDTTLAIAAPQVEVGASATDFEVGCAAPEVLIDQIKTTSPRFPYRDVTLTLMEA